MFIIIKDSLSAFTAISNPCPKNKRIQQEMLTSTNKQILFMWIPSHVGTPGNKKEDSVANEAITSQSSIKINSIPTSKAINNIKNKIIETCLDYLLTYF